MARAMSDDTGGPRDLSMRARVALFAGALALATLPACQQDATPDPFVGPSELGLSLTLSASPDVLPLDGASQSLVTILARDGSGQVVANVALRLQIRFGGILQDFGQLSARTLVTGPNGQALAAYTAPLGGSIDTGAAVEILVTPVGDNYAGALSRTLSIRLVPSGTVTPPLPPVTSSPPSASFVFSPAAPTTTTAVQFNAGPSTASSERTITGYAWNFGDGSTGTGVTTSHTFSTAGDYTVVLTVTDSDGETNTTTAVVKVTATVSGFDPGRSTQVDRPGRV